MSSPSRIDATLSTQVSTGISPPSPNSGVLTRAADEASGIPVPVPLCPVTFAEFAKKKYSANGKPIYDPEFLATAARCASMSCPDQLRPTAAVFLAPIRL